MQKRGTGLDELYETLKQFNTKSKSILPAGNSKAVVTFNFRGHDYMGWNIACMGEDNPIHKLKGKRYYIAEDNEEYAVKTVKEIYGKFENLQLFPGMGSDLFKRVSFRTDYKYAVWEDYVIIYKADSEYLDIYRVANRYQDITRIFE